MVCLWLPSPSPILKNSLFSPEWSEMGRTHMEATPCHCRAQPCGRTSPPTPATSFRAEFRTKLSISNQDFSWLKDEGDWAILKWCSPHHKELAHFLPITKFQVNKTAFGTWAQSQAYLPCLRKGPIPWWHERKGNQEILCGQRQMCLCMHRWLWTPPLLTACPSLGSGLWVWKVLLGVTDWLHDQGWNCEQLWGVFSCREGRMSRWGDGRPQIFFFFFKQNDQEVR